MALPAPRPTDKPAATEIAGGGYLLPQVSGAPGVQTFVLKPVLVL